MNGKDLFCSLNYVNAKFIDEAETVAQLKGEKNILVLRRPVLIAAIIGLLLLLMGCAAFFYSLKQLVVIDHTTDVVAAVHEYKQEIPSEKTAKTLPENTTGPFVAEKVLSLQGYEGSPSYNALQEWWEYAADYTIQNPELQKRCFLHCSSWIEQYV